MKTLTEVVARIDDIIHWSLEKKSPIGYFACTYRLMTLAVQRGLQNGSFENVPRMTALDIAFAQRYFQAWESYRRGEQCTHAWNAAFAATKNPKLLLMQHLTLGINAHINLDLGIAAASVVPRGQVALLKKDFFAINTVIGSINQKVQDSLSRLCAPVALADELLAEKDNLFLDFVLTKARDTSWAAATVLCNTPSLLHPTLIKMLDNAATAVAHNIVAAPKTPPKLLAALKQCERTDVTGNISALAAMHL